MHLNTLEKRWVSYRDVGIYSSVKLKAKFIDKLEFTMGEFEEDNEWPQTMWAKETKIKSSIRAETF